MKVILTVLATFFCSFSINAQELNGYVMRQAVYSASDSLYTANNISGNSITVEFFIANSKKTNVIRIGHKTEIGTTYHDYRVVATEKAKSKLDYNIVVANDQLGGEIAFKYNNEDFVLLYSYDEDLETWLGYYAGVMLNNNTISFLSNKVQSE